jgi:large subunit ribosomal protein L1
MAKTGKKMADVRRRFDDQRLHGATEALELVKSLARAKFDESVELVVVLGVDARKADQIVRGTVALPAGTGRDVRVAVFAQGPQADEARAAGADVVGAEDLVERVDGGFLEFDVAIATPQMMGQVGRLGRVLGPRKLMPNPKTGTVTMEVGRAVSEFKGGRVEYRADAKSHGVVQIPIGKVSFDTDKLVENFQAVVEELLRVKPASAKGRYLKAIAVSATMGPGVKVDPSRARAIDDEQVATAGA